MFKISGEFYLTDKLLVISLTPGIFFIDVRGEVNKDE